MSMRWPGAKRLDGALHEAARRHALQDGVDGRQHDGRVLARRQRQLGQRRHAARDDVGVRADAVVRHRVPGRERDDAHLRREERQRLLQRLEAAVVARDVQQCAGRRPGLRLVDELREHQRVEPFRHAGDDARRVIILPLAGHCVLQTLAGRRRRQSVMCAQRRDQSGKLAGVARRCTAREPLREQRIGQRQEPLEGAELLARHGGERASA